METTPMEAIDITRKTGLALLILALAGGLPGCPPLEDPTDDDDSTSEPDDDDDTGDDDTGDDDTGDDDDATGALSRSLVVPNLWDNDTTSETAGGVDGLVRVVHAGGLLLPDEGGVDISLTLLLSDGSPLLDSAGAPVCDPCTAMVDSSDRVADFDLDALLRSTGFPSQEVQVWGQVLIDGPAPHHAVVTAQRISGTGSGNVRIEELPVIELPATPVSRRYLPRFTDTPGSPDGGGADVVLTLINDGPNEATIDLSLYMPNGFPYPGDGGPLCAPCSWTVGPAAPFIDQVLSALPGADPSTWLEAMGVFDVGGTGAPDVVISGRREGNATDGGPAVISTQPTPASGGQGSPRCSLSLPSRTPPTSHTSSL